MRIRGVLVVFGAFAVASSLSAQTKIAGTATCKGDTIPPVEVGDSPGHTLSVQKANCTWTGLEIEGSPAKEGVSVATGEAHGNSGSSRGYHTGTMANGDHWTCSFQGRSTSKDGKPVGDSGTWAFTNGTGKLKGIKGKGTFKGTPAADGTMTYKIEGEYSLP